MIMNNTIAKYLLSILLCVSYNMVQAVTKNIKEYHLHGNIYCIRVKEYSFSLEFGEITRGNQKSEYSTYFLKNGNVYIDSLVPNEKYKRYYYDNRNNIVEEMCINAGTGRKIQINNSDYHYNDTTNHFVYKYNYNGDGRIMEAIKYIKKNNVLTQTLRIVYSVTNNGKKIVYWTKHGIDKEEIYGTNTKTINGYSSFNDYKSPISISRITLNKNGFPIKMSVEAVGGITSGENVYTYDEHNNIIKEAIKAGNILGEGARTIITRKYDYDKNGNWIRQLEYKNGELKSWIERDIFYATSDSDYTKIVEQDRKITEKHLRIFQKEQRIKDSIDNVIVEEVARKIQYEDSLKAVVSQLDVIIEKEMLQKHIMGIPKDPYNRFAIDMKLREIDGVIKSFNIQGSSIVFTLKKGKTTINVDLFESRKRKYYWAWNELCEEHDDFQIGYSRDYNDIVIASPFVLLLHKENNVYKAYTPDPKITNLNEINILLRTINKKDILFLRDYFQLFWDANKGSVADQYKESEPFKKELYLDINKNDVEENDDTYEFCDVYPQFPGGNELLFSWIMNHLHYPVEAIENGIQGRVDIQFVVEKDGSVVEPRILRSSDPLLDQEAIRVVMAMPKWHPGTRRGKIVRAKYTHTLNFRLY